MPVNLINTAFADAEFSPSVFNPTYISNAGDRITAVYTIKSNVRVSSLANPLQLDPTVNEITWASGDWLAEGFRIGDIVTVTIYTSGGSVINTFSTTVQTVTSTVLNVASCPTWYDITASQFAVISVPSKAGRGDLQFMFNHVSNINGGSEFSLIDGEVTRGVFLDVNSVIIGGTLTANLTGNQSGGYVTNMQLERVADIDASRVYEITVEFLNPGIYDAVWFQSSDCLKTLIKLEWSRDPGDITNPIKITDSVTANTGGFNEAHNIDSVNSVLIQGIDEIDYASPKSFDIIVDGPLTNIGIGASYIPLDENYYKNKPASQLNLGIVSPTTDITTSPIVSNVNPDGAGYTIDIDGIAVAGSQTTISATFTPNPDFFTFMDARDEGDRLFYIWVRCGAVNHLVYSDQLQYTPPPGDPLVLEIEKKFYDHSQNVTDDSIPDGDLWTVFNTEDDLGFFGAFLLEKNKIYDRFVYKIEAYNSTTGADFTLLQGSFSFDTVQISGDGRYLLNESATIVTTLPTTSQKRDAKLNLFPSIDAGINYGVSFYFPFLLRWEYWLQQTNASPDFYPNQSKNWYPYDNTGTWEVRLELDLQESGLSHLYNAPIDIKDYDSEPLLSNDVELKIDSTGQTVGIIAEGELMRVITTHTLLGSLAWDQSNIWGMITAEPYESGPRWTLSSAVNTDFNVLNPLTPLTGSVINITFPAPNVARLECFFNPDKINLQNGVKFTGKIKGCTIEGEINKTTSPDDIIKTTTYGDNKTLAY